MTEKFITLTNPQNGKQKKILKKPKITPSTSQSMHEKDANHYL